MPTENLSQYSVNFESGPNTAPPFSVDIQSQPFAFAPKYHPKRFTQTKDREHDRQGRQCNGENIVLKKIKNREFHITGNLLESEARVFNYIMETTNTVVVSSPVVPRGGMECMIDKAEIGDEQGYDPHEEQRMFEYTLDLISTGRDEFDRTENGIITAITG